MGVRPCGSNARPSLPQGGERDIARAEGHHVPMNVPPDPPAPRPGSAMRRLSAEFVVIFVGVLVALFLESWWAERDDRAFERELRADMVSEFQENLAILEADLAENAEASQVLIRFAEMSDEVLAQLPDTAFQVWADGAYGWAGFDPVTGSARAVVSSGNLGVISDGELRLRLSRWSGLMEEKQRFNKNSTEYFLNVFSLRAFLLGADGRWTLEERREMRAHIVRLQLLQGVEIRNQEDLRDAAAALIEHLGR